MAQDPSNNFVLYRRQNQEMKDMRLHGVLLCLWHSHVDKLPALSGEDLEVMWQIKLPMLVVGLAYKTAVMFTYLAPRPSDGKQAVVQWGKWGKPDG
jgi:proteasome lid subunit RPN8/RPN11